MAQLTMVMTWWLRSNMPQAAAITTLEPNEIFVFGSNTAGRHGAGAARQAREVWGAVLGVGEGVTGQCYAFPTLDDQLNQRPIEAIEKSVQLLYSTCEQNADKTFLLTKVGCGLAGYSENTMKNLFTNTPANLILPLDWQ
jgi:hypothetical protein